MTSIATALPAARASRCVPPAPGMIPRPVSGCFVRIQFVKPRHELLHQLVGERIQLLRAVEQDDRDCVVPLDQNQGVAHFFRNFSIAAFGSSVAIERASQSRA